MYIYIYVYIYYIYIYIYMYIYIIYTYIYPCIIPVCIYISIDSHTHTHTHTHTPTAHDVAGSDTQGPRDTHTHLPPHTKTPAAYARAIACSYFRHTCSYFRAYHAPPHHPQQNWQRPIFTARGGGHSGPRDPPHPDLPLWRGGEGGWGGDATNSNDARAINNSGDVCGQGV